MLLDNDIRRRLISVLREKESLDSFAEWLAIYRLQARREGSPESQHLASKVLNLVYMYDGGVLDEAQFFKVLEGVALNAEVRWILAEGPVSRVDAGATSYSPVKTGYRFDLARA